MGKFRARATHHCIDGADLTTEQAFNLCRANGFDGSKSTFEHRLVSGKSTFAELCKPISQAKKKSRLVHLANSRATCTAALSEVDARRREIAERMKGEEE
jgi:hypothetical protein